VWGQRHAPAAFCPMESPGTHFTGSWFGPGAVWTGVENLAFTGIRSPDRPAVACHYTVYANRPTKFDIG